MNVDFLLRFCKQRKNRNNLLTEQVPVKWRLLRVPAKASITISIVHTCKYMKVPKEGFCSEAIEEPFWVPQRPLL